MTPSLMVFQVTTNGGYVKWSHLFGQVCSVSKVYRV
jgi:hypothetical protein